MHSIHKILEFWMASCINTFIVKKKIRNSYKIIEINVAIEFKPTFHHFHYLCFSLYQAWSDDRTHLKAWQKGNTGYPLVDASMRQLWRIGWTNNYMRHVVASFLLSYLRIRCVIR